MKVNINKVNELLGHMNEYATRAAVKSLGWEITRGSMKPCEAYRVGKPKKNNVINNSNHKPSKGNDERIFINISSVKGTSYGPQVQYKQHWSIMVEEQTNLNFTKFFSINNGMIEPTLEQIDKWKNNGLVVKHIRLYNADENNNLQERSEIKDLKMNIDF